MRRLVLRQRFPTAVNSRCCRSMSLLGRIPPTLAPRRPLRQGHIKWASIRAPFRAQQGTSQSSNSKLADVQVVRTLCCCWRDSLLIEGCIR
ncbi:unnamed protein product [Jaminaea pallidilutea]